MQKNLHFIDHRQGDLVFTLEMFFVGIALIMAILFAISWRCLKHAATTEILVMAVLAQSKELIKRNQDAEHLLALFEHFEENPERIETLPGYSRQATAAALAHLVNSYSTQLANAADALTEVRDQQVESSASYYAEQAARLETIIDDITKRLLAAECAAREFSQT